MVTVEKRMQSDAVEDDEGADSAEKRLRSASPEKLSVGEDAEGAAGERASSGAETRERLPYATKKKVCMLVGYIGSGYQGMQKNPGAKTIEDELERAIYKAGGITDSNYGNLQKISWSRAARTDKGVHAAGQIVSFKCLLPFSPEIMAQRTNEHLPPQIRIFGCNRVTGGFGAKPACESRMYEYLVPSYMFCPRPGKAAGGPVTDSSRLDGMPYRPYTLTQIAFTAVEPSPSGSASMLPDAMPAQGEGNNGNQRSPEDGPAHDPHPPSATDDPGDVEERWAQYMRFRISEDTVAKINAGLAKYVGTHLFHNFTAHVAPGDATSRRFIMSFKCSGPVDIDGVECVSIAVHGQSFLLHHIRKMIGLVVSFVRGDIGADMFNVAMDKDTVVNVPMAPGTGLILLKCLFPRYVAKFCTADTSIHFDNLQDIVADFRRIRIYPQIIASEKQTNEVLQWLDTLDSYHKFIVTPEEPRKATRAESGPASENNQADPATDGDGHDDKSAGVESGAAPNAATSADGVTIGAADEPGTDE